MELISSKGEFNVENFDNFVNYQDCAVVGIIGPQSIGKSTLLNCLFDTNFKEWLISMEMGAQTTKGVHIDKAKELRVLVLDLEGTDSSEAAKNGKAFENQIALFALLFADLLFINIGFKDIGKDFAANRPLLRTILQTWLAMESFKTSSKKTLVFVIRDTVPFEKLVINRAIEKQKKSIVEIWGEVHKPEPQENTSLDQFFNVKVFPLPLYPTNENHFNVEVEKLRQEISSSIEGGFADSGFYKNAKTVWETIKQNEDLNIPSINVLVAFLKCDEIARKKLRHFENDEGWLAVRQDVETNFVSDFGERIMQILSTHLSDYDSKTMQWKADEEIKTEKRQYLESGVFSVVDPVYITNLIHLCSKQLQSFETQLDAELEYSPRISSVLMNSCLDEFDRFVCAAKPDHEQARWDASKVRQELIHKIKLHELKNKVPSIVEKQLSRNLRQYLNSLFDGEMEITWAFIRAHLKGKEEEAMNDMKIIDAALFEPPLDENTRNNMDLRAREVVKEIFKAIQVKIQLQLKRRYIKIYAMKFESYKRENENKSEEECSSVASEESYRRCVKFLSTVAVLRFVENTYNDVEPALISALLDNGVHISDSLTWEEVPAEDTLLTPRDCNEIWLKFKQEMEEAASLKRQSELVAVTSKAFNWKPIKWIGIALLTIGAVGATCIVLRCTNLDLIVLGSLSKEAFLFIAEFIGDAAMVAGAGISMYKLLQELVRNNDVEAFTEFRKKHGEIMEHLKRGLIHLFEHILTGMGSNPQISN